MYSITIPDACFQGIDRWTNVGRQALGRFSWNGKDLRHMIFIISYLRQCISPAPCNLKETSISMLSRSKVALQKVVNQNYNSSELVLMIIIPDDSLGDHVQQLKETHSSLWLPRLPPCVISPWKMCSRPRGRTLRRCTALPCIRTWLQIYGCSEQCTLSYTRYFISVGEKGTVKCHWTRNSNFLAIL